MKDRTVHMSFHSRPLCICYIYVLESLFMLVLTWGIKQTYVRSLLFSFVCFLTLATQSVFSAQYPFFHFWIWMFLVLVSPLLLISLSFSTASFLFWFCSLQFDTWILVHVLWLAVVAPPPLHYLWNSNVLIILIGWTTFLFAWSILIGCTTLLFACSFLYMWSTGTVLVWTIILSCVHISVNLFTAGLHRVLGPVNHCFTKCTFRQTFKSSFTECF